ncbi:CBS domain-containing protein [Phytohabitans sp. ZYX-F-186]|uniref:CBS domain-containing protein n=1 Tax=Phytohabitans maris TaxID=3071409 RepID=A0ABU0ZAD7_9ACTN|nr:CBS domain-containing protein [Phytohabitans sp. ZYX-F-186]MDQ7904017.1 CBS domain-containing protein [Phytohabitans sp. ZYX-F-186]
MKLWTVADVMTTDVATVKEGTPYRDIVDILTARQVSAVPVVDDFERVLGVVSEADLLHKIETEGHPATRRVFEGRRRRAARTKATALVARDLMTVPAVTAVPHTLIPAAARRMDTEHVKRLPVINDLGRLVGIVTRGDLLKVHLRPDADIRRDVVEGVLHRVLAIRDGIVRVEVHDGVVTLAGELDRHSATVTAVRLAQAVAGVVSVEDRLTFLFDDTTLANTGVA